MHVYIRVYVRCIYEVLLRRVYISYSYYAIVYTLCVYLYMRSNFGPNTTTFIIPGEIYPPEVKATCHGLSAAAGKAGAATGAYLFPLILNHVTTAAVVPGEVPPHSSFGLRMCFFVCAAVAILGAVVTHFLIPTYSGRDLEDPDAYLALDHEFLRPSQDTVMYMRQTQQAKAAPYTMIEVIDSADNYCLNEPVVATGGSGSGTSAVATGGGGNTGAIKKPAMAGRTLDI